MSFNLSKLWDSIKSVKSFKDFTKVDYIIIGFICLILLVTALAIAGKNKMLSKTPVEAEKPIAFQVFLRGITITNPTSPFQVGEETFITIRNVPYTKLKIVDVVLDRKKALVPANNANKYVIVDDITLPFQYDFMITLVDNAKITKDGAVVGGNKIKIGVPIVLEGVDYKINGTISNVQVLENNNKTEKNETSK